MYPYVPLMNSLCSHYVTSYLPPYTPYFHLHLIYRLCATNVSPYGFLMCCALYVSFMYSYVLSTWPQCTCVSLCICPVPHVFLYTPYVRPYVPAMYSLCAPYVPAMYLPRMFLLYSLVYALCNLYVPIRTGHGSRDS